MTIAEKLAPLRSHKGKLRTIGLDDATLERFAIGHPDLNDAVDAAVADYVHLRLEFPEIFDLDEEDQIQAALGGYINFYSEDTVNPYVALSARGPWIVTLKGAIVHDSGGYGMLGLGHAPAAVIAAMAKPQVMANVMTASLSQLRLERALRSEIGHRRGNCPYDKFLCLNSGSECVSLAGRIADVNTKLMTDPGAPHAGRKIKRLAVKGGFHGRTELPAQYSDSSRKTYQQYLASYKDNDDKIIVIEPYDIAQLRQAFVAADEHGWHIEAMFLEPVMGEGDPGRAVSPDFYAAARELTLAHGTLLLIDSIQAGLRAHGVLSIVDYPGFETLPAPDMETYSKALNAAQYPLSVLAVNQRAAALYRKGIYGNTMTSNPRALDVASAVLGQLTPAIRANIRDRGREALQKLERLKTDLGGLITKVQGTGLLFSCELAAQFKGYGEHSIEEWLRERGIGVIHGGINSLRFTPHFNVDSEELDLLIGMVGRALKEAPHSQQAVAA